MEVVVPAATAEFHFDSTASSPYVSAPSSPKRFGEFFQYYYHYTSAPTSPSRAAAIYNNFGDDDIALRPSSVIPFDWEERPGTPKSSHVDRREDRVEEEDDDFFDDFAFEFSGRRQEMGSPPPFTAADELFEEGKIRPLKPPPRLHHISSATLSNDESKSPVSSPRSSPKSPISRIFRWPHQRGIKQQEEFDPFARAMEETTRGRDRANPSTSDHERGIRSRAARSLSPLRGFFDFRNRKKSATTTSSTTATSTDAGGDANTTTTGGSTASWIKAGSRKWRLRDLLLFRSASEGRATSGAGGGKDPLRKYTALSPSSSVLHSSGKSSAAEDSKNASFRSTASGGGESVGGSSRRLGVSAHERHYTANRAASGEMKKKTTLAYRQGLFGYLSFNPAVHVPAKGFDSFSLGGERRT